MRFIKNLQRFPPITSRLAVSLLMLSGYCQAGIPNYIGTSWDVGSGWRTASVSKLDIDGNNILGSDGWYCFGGSPTSSQVPGYINAWTATGSIYAGNSNYAKIDNPVTTPGTSPSTETSGTANPNPGANSPAVILTFTLAGNVPQNIRIGMMIDNLDTVAYNPSSLSLVSLTTGASASANVTSSQNSKYADRIPDWVFFEIDGGVSGEQYEIQAYGSAAGIATMGAVAFDSISPTVIEYLRGGGQTIAEIHTPPSYFTDVAGQPYSNAANLFSIDGISAGCGTSPPAFCPSTVLARGDMAILIVRAVYVAVGGAGNANNFACTQTPYFSDVPNSAYYFCAVQRLYELGITAGCGGGNYCPSVSATNSDVAIYSWRGGQCALSGAQNNCGNGSPPSGSYPVTPQYFADVPSSDYLFPFVQNAVSVGVTPTVVNGCPAGSFCETNGMARWVSAEWITRYILGDFNL